MTKDETMVAINGLKDEIAKVELRMYEAGYRALASTLYSSRLRLSSSLSETFGVPISRGLCSCPCHKYCSDAATAPTGSEVKP